MSKLLKEYGGLIVSIICAIILITVVMANTDIVKRTANSQINTVSAAKEGWSISDASGSEVILTKNEASLIDKTSASVTDMQTQLDELKEEIANFESFDVDKVYPIGSVYLSLNSSSPADLFGGTWQKIEDTFLMAAGSEHAAGTTGGSNKVNLSASQIPTLSIKGNTMAVNGIGSTSYNGNHTHAVYYWNALANPSLGTGSVYYGYISDGTHSNTTADGAHTHTLNIPSLTVNGAYNNTSQKSVDITNKYTAVYMWQRVG